jgi:hypothetical protein
MTPSAPATPLIEWHALLQVLYTSVALGLGVVVLFSMGVYSLSLFRRPESTVAMRGLSMTGMGIISLVIAATAVWGFLVIINK